MGCDTSQCGTCVVTLNGISVKSCTVLAAQVDGAEVVTVEGLATNGQLDPLQQGFWQEHGLQCGFCTPGMLMSMSDLLNHHNADPPPSQIRAWLDGNLCRCTGYQNCVQRCPARSPHHEQPRHIMNSPVKMVVDTPGNCSTKNR